MGKIKTKKSLGQNWLKSESALKEIVRAGEIAPGDLVLEIGPGKGALTKELLGSPCGVTCYTPQGKVLAVEKDDRLITELQEKFASEIKNKKLILIHADILKLNFSDSFLKPNTCQLKPPYKLIANIPYYITGQVIRKFLSEEKIQPSLIVLLLQKEVAKRIIADNKKESLLSISVKTYGEPKYIKTVPAGAFHPRPKVDSAILLIKNISRDFFSPKPGLGKNEEKKFFALLKKGFSQKRKLLKNNLGIKEEVLTICQIPANARAENLSIENWHCLTSKCQQY